ncbi:MAG: 50S ribosomal protein L4 [Mycoplasmataceae bacterium]|jgi:large subunit ribosomal protein L4|nr:50S ribosomal protein L4 [Mycoplasmataceae bacterium]
MEKIKMIDLSGKTIGDMDVAKSFEVKKANSQVVFDAIIAENAGKRQGTHSTLTKGEVRGGGKKPFAQKHTGNARQGSIRNPHYVGGGVVFGPKPVRNYKKYINSKITKLALVNAINDKINKNAMYVLEDKNMDKPSTKAIVSLLKQLKINGKKILFVLNNEKSENISKSCRNIFKVIAKKSNQVSTKDVVHANFVISQQTALNTLAKVVG